MIELMNDGIIYFNLDDRKIPLFKMVLKEPFLMEVSSVYSFDRQRITVPLDTTHAGIRITNLANCIKHFEPQGNVGVDIFYHPEFADIMINKAGVDLIFAPLSIFITIIEADRTIRKNVFILVSHGELLEHDSYEEIGVMIDSDGTPKADIYAYGMYYTEGYDDLFDSLKLINDLFFDYREKSKIK